MKIIDKYIIRHLFAPFLFGVGTVMFLFLMQFVMKELDNLLGKGIELPVIAELISLTLAWILVLAVPMGVLFSCLMTFGNLSSTSEITIIKASGGSLIRTMRYPVLFGILMTVFMFWFSDYVLPDTNHRLKTLIMDLHRLRPTFALESGKVSSDLDGYTIFPQRVDSLNGNLYGVTIYDKSQGYKQENIISADSGMISSMPQTGMLNIHLRSGEIHRFVKEDPKDYQIIEFEDYNISIPAKGFELERTEEGNISKGERELPIMAMEEISERNIKNADSLDIVSAKLIEEHMDYLLYGVRKKLSEQDKPKSNLNIGLMPEEDIAGNNDQKTKTHRFLETDIESEMKADTVKAFKSISQQLTSMYGVLSSNHSRIKSYESRSAAYQVEIYKKYSMPFSCLIFVLVGCPLGVMTKGGNFGISAAISLGFYIIYWVFLIGGEKLGDEQLISPFWSMWTGVLVLFLLGVFLTVKVNYENISFIKNFGSRS